MSYIQKPIIQFMETSRNAWSPSTQESLDYVFQKVDGLDQNAFLTEELELLIGKVYREGYGDGLSLGGWLKSGQE